MNTRIFQRELPAALFILAFWISSGLSHTIDGPWNDFDPCFLPNGRIVFNSERRGGYLRCGRHCPTYALHAMAIQSMRSGTYVHPGEQLTCLGCHEPKGRTPERSSVISLALRRAPSEIQPDVDGSNPFNYVRLVQPI